jgi:predicted aspartyl protease
LSCTGTSGSASGAVTLAATELGDNVALVFIDNGPAGASNIINVPFVSATVCRPGTSICQTINHLLLDTGSSGLRIIAPAVLDPALALPAVTGAGDNPAGECAHFVSGYLWGSVRSADVRLAGETAASVQVQLVADSDAAFASVPFACSHTGLNLGTVARLGANGILGVGLFKEDCGAGCTTQVNNGRYYECTTSGCTGTAMPLAKQVANPVTAFATNNNGVVVAMPAVPAGGATTLTGALIFGIGTQSNNQVGTATVYAADGDGNFTTTYKGMTLQDSFLDTGSNGYFFPDAAIPSCSISSGFYCPNSTLSLSALNTSTVNGASGTVNFTVENLQALDNAVRAASVGGDTFSSTAFDWGMPFFFGRTVFVAIEGAGTPQGAGPYWAY